MSELKLDLLMSYDTTGSMAQVIGAVRRNIESFVKEIHILDADIRIGIIAHGDYCDKDNPYTIRAVDFTKDTAQLVRFVRETKDTYGGDADECYELALKTARTEFSWEAGRIKIFIIIGDANPHKIGYKYESHTNTIDWKNETGLLADMSVQIYAIHALPEIRTGSRKFYETLAAKTGGKYLVLGQFHEILDIIKMSYYGLMGEEAVNQFVTILRDNGKISRTMARNIQTITGQEISVQTAKSIQADGLVPVPEGRFQIIEVPENCTIRDFVELNGIKFKKGRTFYELTKAETVQQYKEVILEDKETRDLYTGAQVREYLKLPPQIAGKGSNDKVYADKKREYCVFVQSTSVNRKLIGGTRILYELDDID
ncbi:MAG: VWA domain-containing protein [Oscillospiraceae bacterium]|nr:VWA domain-containing protein [Oscillospiraceae bacterium]